MSENISLTRAIAAYATKRAALPGCISLENEVRNAQPGALVTPADAVREVITNVALLQRPVLAVQSDASAGALLTKTFTPDNADYPGKGWEYVFGVRIEVDFSTQLSRSPVAADVAGYTEFGQTIAVGGIIEQPIPTAGGARASMILIPGIQHAGAYEYMPFAWRPALSAGGGNLDSAQNIVVRIGTALTISGSTPTTSGGLPSGAQVNITLLTRGEQSVDTLVRSYFERRSLARDRAYHGV